MARKFSLPEVAALEVGEFIYLQVPASEVKRKTTLYGARNGKRFTVEDATSVDSPPAAIVTRDADPEPQP